MTTTSNDMELQLFNKVFPEIVNSVVVDCADSDVQKAILWLKDVMEYNVPHRKNNYGIYVVKAFKYLSGTDSITDDDLHLVHVLGWCADMFLAFILVADDIMDKSELRRGKACWHQKEGVGLIAINDVLSLESCVYMLLKRHFRHKKYYIDIVELFQEVTFQIVLGQSLDMQTSLQLDFSEWTIERYSAIAKYKSACGFYLPIALSMFMAGVSDVESHHRAKEIVLEIGHLYQVYNDFIDYIGDPLDTGKLGSDVAEGKCSWLIVTALQWANETQKNIIQENYHRKEPGCQAKIKALYEELGPRST